MKMISAKLENRVFRQRDRLSCSRAAGKFPTPAERGHSRPQQRTYAPRLQNLRDLSTRSTMLRTAMSVLRFGCGFAAVGLPRLGAKVLSHTLSVALIFGCECWSTLVPAADPANAGGNTHPHENGAYAAIQEASTPEKARIEG